MRNFYLKKITILFVSLFFLTTSPVAQEPHLLLTEVIGGLTSPVQLTHSGDGTNRLFIVLQGNAGTGTILVYNQSFVKLDTFLKVTNISTGGEQGLLGMAFHPDYGNTGSPYVGRFYVYYTNSNGDIQIARYTVSGNANVADPASKDTLITIPHPGQSNHNGGTIRFGGDGYLYVATGDGGGAGDPSANAQNPTSLLGKLLRYDVNNADSIPATNPHKGVTAPDTLDAIYAFGLRNPFRWSFDSQTGDIWIGDVGQGNWEEIDFRPADSVVRTNFGWRCFEGHADYNTSGCSGHNSGVYRFPIHVYPNPGGAAVTGGTVYRGSLLANAPLIGYYLAADFYSGTIYKIKPDGSGGWTVYPQPAVRTGIAEFGVAENGEIFAVSLFGGNISSMVVDQVLPVRLTNFTASIFNNAVKLNWKTSFEENLSKFEIEYSTDMTGFRSAGIVAAVNSPSGAQYSFNHNQSLTGRVFYRLKMFNIDNSFEYSNIVSVAPDKTDKNFARPSFITSGVMNIYLENSYNTIEVMNMKGALLLKQDINGRTGKIDIPLSSIPSGMYIVQLRSKVSTVQQKVIIR